MGSVSRLLRRARRGGNNWVSQDPYYNNVELYLPLNADLKDYSKNDYTPISIGSNISLQNEGGPIQSPYYMFGQASYVYYNTIFNIGSLDFTIETFTKTANSNKDIFYCGVFSVDCQLGVDYSLLTITSVYTSSGRLGIYMSNSTNGWNIHEGNNTPSNLILVDDTWHHIAICKTNSEIRFFFDGINVKNISTGSLSMLSKGTTIVGKKSDALSQAAINSFQHLRVTKGVGRYLENFNPSEIIY